MHPDRVKSSNMATWRKAITILGNTAESQFDVLKHALEKKLGSSRTAYIRPYLWFGTENTVSVRGRALRANGLRPPEDADGTWNNLLNSYRRFNSDEIGYAKIRVFSSDFEVKVQADDEGYFSAEIPNQNTPVYAQLIEPPSDEITELHTLIPPASANLGIISDVDDTILQTHATNLLRVAQITFLQNAKMRLTFPGVAALYHALQNSPAGNINNPIFYVSSSPWNLYDLLTDFMSNHDIPLGPMCLRDLGIDEEKFITTGHGTHKIKHIELILSTYPNLPFVLIGDSGQHDPEVYAEIAQRYPERIRAIYIRDVTGESRDAEVTELAGATAVPMLLCPTSETAAVHAAQINLISEPQLAAVKAAVEKQFDPLDDLLG